MTSSSATRDILVVGLHNTHALKMEALRIMNRQVERLRKSSGSRIARNWSRG